MKKYVFKIYQRFSDGEIDDQNVWVSASSESEARSEIRSEYYNIVDMILLKVE